MAMSLEDLLAEEGFKRRKAKIKPRTSFASEGRRSTSLYLHQHESGSLLAVKRTERTQSDIPQHDSKGEFSTSRSIMGGKPRDNLIRRAKLDSESVTRASGKHERAGHRDSWDARRFSIGSSQDLRGSEITEAVQRDEIVEAGTNRSYKGVYLNQVYDAESNIVIDNKQNRNNSFGHPLPEQTSSRDINRRSMKQPQSLDIRSSFNESRAIRQTNLDGALATPAVDEAAVKALISILSGYAKRFVKNEEFRTSLHHNSFASMNFMELDKGLNTESKVIENLEEAIEIVERAADESATLKELKKASLQLSVITGLNSSDLKGGFTSGIPNFKLSACAHLYLSVIYVLQKKDRSSAKHLLQVFCDSPFQARTTLLPDLWDRVFLPHLSDLKLWYNKETHSLADSPISSNLKLLEKVYYESLDSGTYQFAMYYKDWITEGFETPSVPLIKIPSFSVRLMPRGGLHGHTSSPASHVSPQPIVSKKLYDEVFRHSHKSTVELEVYEVDNFDASGRSSNSPAPEDKQLILYSHGSVTSTNENFEPDPDSPTDNLPVAKEAQILHPESLSRVASLENYGNCQWHQENSHMSHTLRALPPELENKFLLKSPENPALEHRQIEESVNHVTLRSLPHPEDARLEPSVQEKRENYEDFRGKPSLCSIPKDFLCPLTGLLFEDPVTLETGQTFERKAITEWFSKGSLKTCPVTIKKLQYQAVPPTNHILKRVIDKWKKDHFEYLLDLLSQVAAGCNDNIDANDNMTICILEQLLTVFSEDERIMNARRIISFGGLQLLLRRFDCGSTQEKTFVLPLLCYCIEAVAGCRNDIARNMKWSNLLELLHNEQLKLRTHAVLLLTKLICLNRRTLAKRFLEDLRDEEIINAMNDLLIHLQSCPLEQTPLVAVLLLHLDLLSEMHKGDKYRQEAVDALTIALERSLSDEKVEKKCSEALLILGGFISFSGKLMTEDWILKLAGFLTGPDLDTAENDTNDIALDATATMVDSLREEENAREKWLVSLSASLLGDGKKPFLNTLSKCLSLGNSDLVRVCLVTVAWLSSSVASLRDAEFQLFSFSALIASLKQCLEHGEVVEQRILASLSLLNFSAIAECRVLLKKIAEGIGSSLEDLVEATWTAKELYDIISGQRR